MNINANSTIADISLLIAERDARDGAYDDIMDMLKSPSLEEAQTAAMRIINNQELPDCVRILANSLISCWSMGLKIARGDYDRDFDQEAKDLDLQTI